MNAVLADLPPLEPTSAPAPMDALTAPELAGLLTEVAAGEHRALERFYRSTIGKVFSLARRIVHCPATAEEVAEDVYVQVWHSAVSYDPQRATPLGWVLMICRSRAIDALRRADTAIVDADPATRSDAMSQHHAPDLQDLLQTHQEHAALHAALGRLRPEQRQLLALAFFRGLTHTEIAAEAQLPLGTVKSHIRRALTTLQGDLSAA